MKARVVLLNLYYTGHRFPSLASGTLRCWALADKDLAAAVALDFCDAFTEESPGIIAERIAEQRPHVAGFSCYVWNINATLAVARELKRLLPDTHVLLGGPEAGGLARQILESTPEIDFVATGEGEETFRLLLRALFLGYGDIASVPGLARRDGGRVIIEPEPSLIDLACASSPYLGGHVFIPRDSVFMVLETSRGCPFACSFCDWGPRKMRYLGLQRIEEEFRFVLEHTSFVITNDADILTDRARAVAIMEAFLRAARGRPAVLAVETNPVHLRPEIVDFVAQAPGNFFFAFGLQSISPHVNKIIGRPFNLDALEARLAYFKSRCPSVKTHFSLIYGLPGDSLRGYKETLEWALKYRPTRFGLNQCLALPGSELAGKAHDFGLEVENGAPHRVLSTPAMTANDVKEARRISSLVLFVFHLPPLRERFLSSYPAQMDGQILPLLNGWERFLIKIGIRIETCARFDQALEFPVESGELNAREFQRDPIKLAAIMKATDIFLGKEGRNNFRKALSAASAQVDRITA